MAPIYWISDFIRLLFPPCCIVCEQGLSVNEKFICVHCLIDIPKTNYHLVRDNKLEKLFWGKIPVERVSSYFNYVKGSGFEKILYELKYYGQKEVGLFMGRCMTMDMLSSDFFDGIDLIIPLPLHAKRQKKRGYNQSEWLAKGVSEVTGIPIDVVSVKRIAENSTQTHKNSWDRWDSVQGIFSIASNHNLQGKHVLLIDDVLTTGATILACASELAKAEGIKISILTLVTV